MITPEREYSFDVTKSKTDRLVEILKEQKVELTVGCMNDPAQDPYPTYYSVLTVDDKLLVGGNGKGRGEQSRLSAVFESFEHLTDEPYYCTVINQEWQEQHVTFLHHSEITANDSELDKMVEFKNFRENEIDEVFPCVSMTSLLDPSDRIFVPYCLLTPSYPFPYICTYKTDEIVYDDCYMLFSGDSIEKYNNPTAHTSLKYTSSNGGATGIDVDEAVLHAMNELVERDSVSMFLLNCFSLYSKQGYKKVDIASLPDDLSEIAH